MDDLNTVARPYAAAAFAQAKEEGNLDLWSEMLHFLADVIGDPDLQAVLANPKVSEQQRLGLVIEVAGGRLNATATNLVRAMAQYRRLAALPEVALEFDRLKAKAEDRIEVDVTSAYALNAKHQKIIEDAMRARFNRDVIVHKHIDRELLAGVVIKAGDHVIDISARGRLEALTQELMG